MNIQEMSKYKARKLIKELKIEEKRLSIEIPKMIKSRDDIFNLIELMNSHISPDP